MKEVDISKLLFRASSMGDIMTSKDGITEKQIITLAGLDKKIGDGKSLTPTESINYKKLTDKKNNPQLGKTTLRKAIEILVTAQTSRQPQVKSKYLTHGTDVEEDSITLYSIYKGQMFYKHKQRINDSHFTGEIDTSDVDKNTSILESSIIIDAKSCWEVHTMPTILDSLERKYIDQMQTYMGLIPRAEKAVVAKILTNHTAENILKEIFWICNADNDLDIKTEATLNKIKELEKNRIYDRAQFKKQNPHYDFYISEEEWKANSLDIPLEERVHEFIVERDDKAIQSMRDRVDEVRQWLIENIKHA